jgi:hypothetical protein
MMHTIRKHFLATTIMGALAVALLTGVVSKSSVSAQSKPRVDEGADRVRPQEPGPVTKNPSDDSGGQMKADIIPQNSPDVASPAQTRSWTSAGSTGALDEDSTGIAQVLNFEVALQPGATGSVHIRYNITAVDGINAFCPATQSTVRVRFRNSDNSGAAAKVSFDIHSTDVSAGGNNIVYSFTSNGIGNGAAFTTFTATPALDFDFTSKVYWIEATIFRSDPAQRADLGTIQIWENAGTACP